MEISYFLSLNYFQLFFHRTKLFLKGPVTLPTIVVLGPKLASDFPYVAYFGGKSTSKFGLPALFERPAFRL